jgi:hypothetical protein
MAKGGIGRSDQAGRRSVVFRRIAASDQTPNVGMRLLIAVAYYRTYRIAAPHR